MSWSINLCCSIFLSWAKDRLFGLWVIYMVKTGYWNAFRVLRQDTIDSEKVNGSTVDTLWSKIWKWICWQSKKSSFERRLMISLPLKSTWWLIMYQEIPGASSVVFIGLTLLMILSTACSLKKGWKATDWWEILKNLEGCQTIDIIHYLGKIMSQSDFERFCIKLWVIWKDRCSQVHNPIPIQGT